MLFEFFENLQNRWTKIKYVNVFRVDQYIFNYPFKVIEQSGWSRDVSNELLKEDDNLIVFTIDTRQSMFFRFFKL